MPFQSQLLLANASNVDQFGLEDYGTLVFETHLVNSHFNILKTLLAGIGPAPLEP